MLQIVGYADRLSARPGEEIAVKVSCEAGAKFYEANLVRLICGDDRPDGPGFKAQPVTASFTGSYRGQRQPIVTGSYIEIPGDDAGDTAAGMTIAALIRPSRPASGLKQTIISHMRPSTRQCDGYDLRLNEQACLEICLHAGTRQQVLTLDQPLTADIWYLVAASMSGTAHGTLSLSARPMSCFPFGPATQIVTATPEFDIAWPKQAPVLIAAAPHIGEDERSVIHQTFDGKIEAPAIYHASADAASLSDHAHPHEFELSFWAAWDFSRGMEGRQIIDISGNKRHGRAVNLPTRAVTGHLWCGQTTNWRDRPDLYGAIHFHVDDLYDAAWKTDFSWTVPADLQSGIYAFRVQCGDGPEAEDHIPFFVLPPRDRPSAPIAFLASTFTYLAYANSHHGYEDPLSEVSYGRLLELGPAELFLKERRDFGISLYDRHLDGSGACYSSARRPILNTRPKRAIWNFNADLHIIDWLEAIGQSYDVITDDRLHAEGLDLLRQYRCIVTGSHPEYHSTAMMTAIGSYLNGGGRLMYLGGNGFYWRIATHPDWPDAIEVRRGEAGTRCHEMPPGERYHGFTGEFGGLWRSQGLAPQRLVGIGYVAEGFDQNSYYIRLEDSFSPRAAFIFDGVDAAEKIGDFGSLGGAAGYELDAADAALGTPPHALILARSVEHTSVYLLTPEELLYTHPGIDGIENDRVRAEMVFFECPEGGAVFSTGSITWASALAHAGYRNNVAQITGNVLRRFISPEAFDPK
jgi:N,N-dimethylformamidase